MKKKEIMLYYMAIDLPNLPASELFAKIEIDPKGKKALLHIFDGESDYEQIFPVDKETLYKLYQELKKIFEIDEEIPRV